MPIPVFEPVNITSMKMYDREKRGKIVLANERGDKLTLDMSVEVAAALVASTQSLFVSIYQRGAAGRPLRRHNEWAEIANRAPQSVHADSAEMQAETVILSVDENTRFEVNYRLSPDQADVLAQELAAAATAARSLQSRPSH